MATASPPPNPDVPPDPKSYYGYLFQPDKAPTPLFDTLLRAIAQHIIDNIGDKEDKTLSPLKLAAFYKAVGHDYDSLFVDSPHESISFIWQITGCQHSLQPTADDFAPPSIPALTLKGFVRWQSVETLLCPEVHVPLLQRVAKEWGLMNPDTGKPFPTDLPKEALPSKPDAEVEKWHDQCANKLRREATMADKDGPPSPKTTSKPVFKESTYYYPRARTGAAPSSPPPKARGVSPHGGPETPEDLNGRTFSFNHVPPRYVPSGTTTAAAAAAATFATAAAAAKWTRHVRLSPPEDDRRNARRRSFSDYPPAAGPGGAKMRTHSPPIHSSSHMNMSGTYAPRPRRHSHPHHHSASSDSSDDGDDELPAMRPKSARRVRQPDDPPLVSVRRVYPPQGPTVLPDTFPPGPMPSGKRESSSSGADRRRREERIPIPPQGRSPHRSPHRTDEPRPRAFGVASDIRDKLSSVLPNGILGAGSKPERPRSSSRSQSHNTGMGSVPLRYSKESLQGSRLGRSWSYDSDEGDDGSVGAGGGDRERTRLPRDKDRDPRDRDHDRGRDRPRRDRDDREYVGRREHERERDRSDHIERPYRAHEKDRDRERDRDRDRDVRERDRDRDVDRRERDRGSRDALREKKKAKSLDRSRDRERDRDLDRGDRDDDRERDYRSSRRDRERDRDRERERDRHPLRPEPLKRPVSTADLDRER